MFVVVQDNERGQSLESTRPILVKQRQQHVYRPVPVIQPVFIEHPVDHHKRRSQFYSEESQEIKISKKSKLKKEKHEEKKRTDAKHHYHYVPYPKAKPFRPSPPVDCSKWDVTTTSRQSEIMTLAQKIIVNVAEAASPSLWTESYAMVNNCEFD